MSASGMSGSSMEQVAAHVAQELIEMKAQSSTAAYLKESAAQVEILQLQAQAYQTHKTPSLSADDMCYAGPAIQALNNIIGCNSKPLFQDTSVPGFMHENFDPIAAPSLDQQGAPEDPHGNSSHGNQERDASHSSDLSGVFIIERTPTERAQGVRDEIPQTGQKAASDDLCISPETEIPICILQNSSSDLGETPTVFYVKTLLEANEAVRNFEKETGTKYCAYKSTAGFGNTEYDPAKPHKIYFEERSVDLCGFRIPYDGIPFINVGKKVMDCQYGVDRCVAAKRKYMELHLRDVSRRRRPLAQERTKKVQCRAQIRMKEILKYPDFKVQLDSTSRQEKVRLSRELREALKNGMAKGEKRIYLQLPKLSDHKGHPLGREAVKEVKPCLSGKQAVREINALSWDAFIRRFGNIVEHGHVVASAAWAKRPFANMRALHAAFCEYLDTSSSSGKEAIFRCYPSLAINPADESLSTDSRSEFQAAGLQGLSPEESALLAQLNAKYRDIFHFSFVICLRETNKEALFTGLHGRIHNARDAEILNALEEVKKVAWYRILDQVRSAKQPAAH